MENVSKQAKVDILDDELKNYREQQYLMDVRGRVAANLGNQKVLDAAQKASEEIIKTIAFLTEEREKVLKE